jgi:hypothetical protein
MALLPQMRAASDEGPSQPENFSGSNTFDGFHALFSQTANTFNTAVGWQSLATQTTAEAVTGCGAGTLTFNTADNNSAFGAAALEFNTGGGLNVAVGGFSLLRNTTGSDNTAVGMQALENNVSGVTNAALGVFAAQNGTSDFNVAVGGFSLKATTAGTRNTAVGAGAMESGNAGNDNTAVGELAGNNIAGNGNNCFGSSAGTSITTGNNNVVVGNGAGGGLTSAANNIVIGAIAEAGPFANLNNTVFINSIFGEPVSDPGSQVPVFVDMFNVVGVFNTSSRTLKHDIKPMDKASETIYQFKPVTFKYNSDWKGTTQYGLIAEEVAEVDPQLVVRGRDGEIMAVHYEQISNMLLNEFLKEHKKVEEQQASISQLKSEMQTMVAQLKEQAAQIQKVSAQLEVSKPTPQVVVNKP